MKEPAIRVQIDDSRIGSRESAILVQIDNTGNIDEKVPHDCEQSRCEKFAEIVGGCDISS